MIFILHQVTNRRFPKSKLEICLQPLIEDLLQSLESETSSSVLNFGHSDTIQVRKKLRHDPGEKAANWEYATSYYVKTILAIQNFRYNQYMKVIGKAIKNMSWKKLKAGYLQILQQIPASDGCLGTLPRRPWSGGLRPGSRPSVGRLQVLSGLQTWMQCDITSHQD